MSKLEPTVNFLDFIPAYPDIDDPDFYEIIARKREFATLKLEPNEDIPAAPGDLMKHQQFIQRFMSRSTLYDKLVLFHDVGTGKTCSVVAAAEALRVHGSNLKKTLVILPGPRNITTFRSSLAEVCTHGQYLPVEKPGEIITAEGRNRRIINLISRNYEFMTFLTLAKLLSGITDQFLIKNYSNRLIIIDEAHGIRTLDDLPPQDGPAKKRTREEQRQQSRLIYSQIHRLLHLAKNTKIILMTATPMQDSASELSSLMNLILPTDKQLPVGENFLKEFMTKHDAPEESTSYYTLTGEQKETLKNHIRTSGIAISRVRGVQAQRRIEMGRQGAPITRWSHVVPSRMSDHQTKVWMKSRSEDRSYLSRSRQASLWVYPDETYGRAGFEANMRFPTKVDPRTNKPVMSTMAVFQKKTHLALFGKTKLKVNEIIARVSLYSSIMANMLAQIMANPTEAAFVHFDFVEGGALVFAALLRKIGFEQLSGNRIEQSEKPRFALLTGKDKNKTKMKNLMATFNQPANKYGKICRIFVGSRVTGQSFSLFNVRQVHITALWNDPSMEQAIGRAFRGIFSHAAFDNEEERYVKVYRHASVPTQLRAGETLTSGTDLRLYRLAESKEVGIRMNIQALEEMAVDCYHNSKRNRLPTDQPFTKQCNFQQCEVSCDRIPADIEEKTLIDDSYLVYYRYGKSKKVQEHVADLLSVKPVWTFDQFEQELLVRDPDLDVVPVELALSLIDLKDSRTEHLADFMGRPRDLAEFNNWYMLSEIPAKRSVDTWYVNNEPILRKKSLSEALVRVKQKNSGSVRRRFAQLVNSAADSLELATKTEQLTTLIKQLPHQQQSDLLESAIRNKYYAAPTDDSGKRQVIRKIVLKLFVRYINTQMENTIISTFWTDGKMTPVSKLRCMNRGTGTWGPCAKDINKRLKTVVSDKSEQLMDNPYGLYGAGYDKKGFIRIRDFGSEGGALTDERKKNERVCKTQPWSKLTEWFTRLPTAPDMEVKDTSIQVEEATIDQLYAFFDNYKTKARDMSQYLRDLNATVEMARRVARWVVRAASKKSELTKPRICKMLEQWLKENNLMIV